MVTEKEELKEEFEPSRDELEELKQEKEALVREIETGGARIASLEQALAGKDGEIAALKQSEVASEKRIAELAEALSQAVASYKAMVIEQNPGVLAEMITGDTIGEVDESLRNARALVERVRQEMEAESSRAKVPAGAPQRAPVDLSALSPREKIQYAIRGSSS